MSNQTSAPYAPGLALAAGRNNARTAALLTIAAIVILLAGYYQTVWSMVSIWERSETFTHCFLIVPISAWMIWNQRDQLARVPHRPNPLALVVMAVLGFGWMLAALANVLVFQQYFIVAMIPVTVWSILGIRMAWAMAFPLAYLLLAVPFGEVLIPTLINFTADFTVMALQWTGIPIYREGNFFMLPTGNWSVVEACSGLRYLIASVTLGTLYAYLTYQSTTRRIAFIAMAIIVPIIANGLRAYMIVMMGHLSGMTMAVGFDHLIYGWVFFGIVMLLLFWVGSFWREDSQPVDKTAAPAVAHGGSSASLKATTTAAILTVVVAFIWPAYAAYLDRDNAAARTATIAIPGMPGKWQADAAPLSNWKPGYAGTPARFEQHYKNDAQVVGVHIAQYHHQRPGSQLITSANLLVPENEQGWNNVAQTSRTVTMVGRQMVVTQNQVLTPSKKLLVWRWYRLGNEETASPYIAKMLLAKHKLLNQGDDGAEVIIAAPYDARADEAVPALQAFLNDMAPAIAKGVADAAGR
ncbi:MAG: exosortase A [Pseudomonadota bacterium]